jgi:hypothetical protein
MGKMVDIVEDLGKGINIKEDLAKKGEKNHGANRPEKELHEGKPDARDGAK